MVGSHSILKIHPFHFISAILILQLACNYAPEIEWQKTYGGKGKDIGTSIEQTKDGGYIVAGYTGSFEDDVKGNHGCYDYWILKLDAMGNIQWQKTLGGDYFDEAHDVHQTADGGYIVCGYTYSFDGDVKDNHGISDTWIVKLDAVGNIQWKHAYGFEYRDFTLRIFLTKDGGYLVTGSTQISSEETTNGNGTSYALILKIDSTGNLQWTKKYGGSKGAGAGICKLMSDNNYLIFGSATSGDGDVGMNYGKTDLWIFMLDSIGNLQWKRIYGGSGDEGEEDCSETHEGGFFLTCYTASSDRNITGNHGGHDTWLLKLDSLARLQWQHCYGGSFDDDSHRIIRTKDGNYVLAGESSSVDGDVKGNHGLKDGWIFKIDSNGKQLWSISLGGSRNDDIQCIRQTTDGGFITAGMSESSDGDVTENKGKNDFWIVKLRPDH